MAGYYVNAATQQSLTNEISRATAAETAIGARVPAASTSATPALLIGGAAPSAITYSKQTLLYVQLGPVVEFVLDVEWTALTSASGAVTLTGLPSGAIVSPEMAVGGYGITAAATPYAVIGTNGTISILLSSATGAQSADTPLPGTALGSAGGVLITGRVFVA